MMDSRVWNFLMACWVKDSDRGGRFDFGMAASIRNDIIKRRASLVRDVMVQKNVDEYGPVSYTHLTLPTICSV